jgi:hypothetical protein
LGRVEGIALQALVLGSELNVGVIVKAWLLEGTKETCGTYGPISPPAVVYSAVLKGTAKPEHSKLAPGSVFRKVNRSGTFALMAA